MEDLGDRAAYAEGRTRSKRFGDCYLRLDLDLLPGMAVTIEPGFYNVPAILADESITGAVGADLDRGALSKFSDVRGIRIEDDVLCTEGDPEVLTRRVPKEASEIEALLNGTRWVEMRRRRRQIRRTFRLDKTLTRRYTHLNNRSRMRC